MPDWGDLLDRGLDKLDHGVQKAKKAVGEGVDKATDGIGAGLEYVGADDWADKVEDWGDDVASDLGVSVGEQQLGQTEQANELVHGKPAAIRESAKHLTDFQGAFDRVGQGMRALDSGHWKGQAAEAFRAKFAMHPTHWLHASDACEAAAGALNRYAETVEWAQQQAQQAVDLYKTAVKAAKDAHDAYATKVDAYNAVAKAGDDPGPKPQEPVDVGKADGKRAHEILNEARKQRDEAADTAAKALAAALAHAPKEPRGRDRALAGITDYYGGQAVELNHFVGGVVKGTAGLVNFTRGLNPIDPYNLTHPAEYEQNVATTLAGLVSTAAHPDRIVSGLAATFKDDASEGAGRFLPDLLGTKGSLSALRIAEGAAESAVKAGSRRAAREAAETEGSAAARSCGERTCRTDPVDMATGRMVLPQTDLLLPGSLPFAFTRTFESSYRTGRWFGPAWASTVDQRLEIDEQGVILVREDGSLLTYPHPAGTGAPVLPDHGQRWPLALETDGGYTVTDPETGHVRHFTDTGCIAQIDDRNGAWITFAHDDAGTPTGMSHSGGYELRLTSSGGRITALALADGTQILSYGYTDGHLTHVVNSSGLPLRFGYDDLGRITSWTDTNHRRFDYTYDDRHRCVAQSGTSGHLNVRFTYGDGVTTLTDSHGHITRFLVDGRARITSEIDPVGATTRYTHDEYNRLLTRTDPLGNTCAFTYDEQGRLITITRPDGRTTRAEYNAMGLPTLVVQPDGRTASATYDSRGNRISAISPEGATTHFAYDTRGNPASVTDALGRTSTVRCNAAGLLLEATDPTGARTTIVRDSLGRPTAITDPLGRTNRMAWSVEGRLIGQEYADGTAESWTYDGEGNCIRHTDPCGATTRFTYGEFDLLIARTDPDGARYSFAHDTELRLTEVINPQGMSWTYAYDAVGRISGERDFDGRTVAYAYDAAGRLATRTNAVGCPTTFTYNSLSQLLQKETKDGLTTYRYDEFDQLAEAVTPQGVVLTRQRDSDGRLLTETVDGRGVSYTYDPLGRRISRTTSSGARSEWTYDSVGRPGSLVASGRTITFERDPSGRELTRTFAGVWTLTHEYDLLGRVTSQHVRGEDGRTLQRRGYSYRADSHLIALDDALAGLRTFTLDAGARVTAVDATNWAERYTYDDAGNQTSGTWPTRHPGAEAQGERAYDGTRISRAGSVHYAYDALGRTVMRRRTRLSRKAETWRYTWDAEDRMSGVTTPDGTVWQYRYDALSRRTAKQRLAPTGEVVEEVLFTWDGSTLCEESSGPLTLTWTHDGLHPVTQVERVLGTTDDRFFAIVTDLIGTPRELVDESGSVAWRARSTLWGSTTWTRDAAAYTPLRFPGQYFDPETGLHHNYFRTYDPETARFLSPDPLGLAPAFNPAAYVHNPHTWSDPLGLKACSELGLSNDAERAIEKLENIKRDPLKDVNSEPNHNHYDAARREANGEVVARKKDGTPFDHIADLQNARNGLDNVRRVLEREIDNLPPGISDRGLEVLIRKRKETIEELDRLNGFLHSIGHRK